MNLFSITTEGESLIRSCESLFTYLFPQEKRKNSDSLIIVTPHLLANSNIHPAKIWKNIHTAWRNITFAKKDSCLNDWRRIYYYGEEIIPGFRIFKLKNIKTSSYFFLVDKTEKETISLLNHLFMILRTEQVINNNGGIFHGAGLSRFNQAYIFLGSSGSGKSTISFYSKELGYEVIHDDHVVIFKSKIGKYYLSDIATKKPGVSLKSLFFLIQDKEEKLVPLSQCKTVMGLFRSFFEIPGEKILYGQNLVNAFKVSSDIARAVPGYELHFTKSAAFWKVIEDETGL